MNPLFIGAKAQQFLACLIMTMLDEPFAENRAAKAYSVIAVAGSEKTGLGLFVNLRHFFI